MEPAFPSHAIDDRVVERCSSGRRVSFPVVDGQGDHVFAGDPNAGRHRGAVDGVRRRCIYAKRTLPRAVVDGDFVFVDGPQFLFFREAHFPGEFLRIGWAVNLREPAAFVHRQ